MKKLDLSLRLFLPAIWLGIIIAIDGFEAPLKFQAPGITIPLGLGIGKLVFTAMNACEILLAALIVVATLRTKYVQPAWTWVWSLVALLAAKVAIIRPLLNIRTEAVIAGESAPFGYMHAVYIVVDFLIVVALIVYMAKQARHLVRAPEPIAA
ncbi:hypothetical protein QP027_01205 [Corynebacterium breve]|uniref:Uncharacterized protein n=1 Tax=Corynebacterium breve TaxID=3049799 RepID=A0ABY8VEG3_9CORY|nr:hypothetical protein [Corynebacterium breve]WIM68049.1 hypothetical protein QP027_01205 [Corynebacterium breve]